MPTKLPAKSALRTRAHKELAREQSDVLAFVDPRRELEELPEGLETGFVKRRKRGARTDSDCVNEICELVSRGITATAAVAYIGVPWATWQSWLKTNNATAREKFDLAYECHLEAMADATLRIYEQLKEQRDAAMKGFTKSIARGVNGRRRRKVKNIRVNRSIKGQLSLIYVSLSSV